MKAKILKWLSIGMTGFLTCSAGLVAAESDRDGDGLPDDRDALPGIADFPVLWSVEGLTFHWVLPDDRRERDNPGSAWKEASSLVLFRRDELGAAGVGSCLGAARTVGPEDPPRPGRNAALELGLFGSGHVPWEPVQQIKARRLSMHEDIERRGALLEFAVRFENPNRASVDIVNLSVPVTLGRRVIGQARQSEPSEIRLSADQVDPVTVSFELEIEPRRVSWLLERMEREAPSFRLEDVDEGLWLLGSDGVRVNLVETLREIMDRTVPVRVRLPMAREHVWRVARRNSEGGKTEIGDWAREVIRGSESCFGGIFWLEREGVLTSLAGWDQGAWDRWWHLVRAGRDSPWLADWRLLKVDRETLFEMRATPHGWLPRERRWSDPAKGEDLLKRIRLSEDTTLMHLAGWVAWLREDIDFALAAFRHAAEGHFAPARHRLGCLVYKGQGLPANHVEAVKLFHVSAEQGYAPSAFWLGRCYQRGTGVQADRTQMAVWYGNAALQGYPEAMAFYATCLERGIGVEPQPDAGRAMLRRAAARGGSTAQLALGRQLLQQQHEEGADWLRCAARQGEPRAATLLGRRLLEQDASSPDEVAEALTWLKQAAEADDPEAQLELGQALRVGTGGRTNKKQAFKWLSRAAEQGLPKARVWAGLMLLEGEGVARDRQAARQLVMQAAEDGSPYGQLLAGIMAGAGIGVERDENLAVKWYRKAVEQEVALAEVLLGLAYYGGRGVPEDKTRAADLFRRAAEQGEAVGQIWLAACLAQGQGLDRDLNAAREWAMRAARQGHPGGGAMLRRLPRE